MNQQDEKNPLQLYSFNQNKDLQGIYDAQSAALAPFNPKENAHVDSLIHSQIQSRKLLSEQKYSMEVTSENRRYIQNRTNKYNLTSPDKNNTENIELVLINGTWHLIDLNICYQKLYSGYNITHVKK